MAEKKKTKRALKNKAKREAAAAAKKELDAAGGEKAATDAPLKKITPSKKRKLMSVQETCDLIAELGESILENPQSAFTSTETQDDGDYDDDGRDVNNTSSRGPSKMQQLLILAHTQNTETQQYTAQLAILSLLAIFKDILPAYRIRVPTAQEMAVKVSKETKILWDYERALLQSYQQYLKLLERTWEKQRDGKKNSTATNNNNSTVSITAILTLAELLKAAFHFNFRSNLLTAVVRQMNNTKSEPVRNACCQAVEFVFRNDAQGEVALEAARQVAKLIKDRSFKVKAVVLQTFLALPLRVHVDEAEAAKLASQVNAKKRKRDKATAEIEADLRESQATVDKIVLARCQSDTLQTVTLTYFRVLKSDNLKASHIEELLPPALEGLAKFAPLINIDTVVDLLGVLKDLLRKVDRLPVDAALNCILTAFQTLQGPGKEMQIDQKEYIVPLYSQLPRLCSEQSSIKNTDIMIQCLTAAFIKRREYSTVRVAAFLKQILTTALHTSAHTSVPLIAFARLLIHRYPSAEQMLENEQDVITSGEYTPDVEDPEHSNPFATSAWELATLKFHLNADISSQAVGAASSKMLQLPGESPEKLRAALLNDTMNELYIPFHLNKKKHPLAPKQQQQQPDNNGNTTAKKQRRQLRFITPRSRSCKLVVPPHDK